MTFEFTFLLHKDAARSASHVTHINVYAKTSQTERSPLTTENDKGSQVGDEPRARTLTSVSVRPRFWVLPVPGWHSVPPLSAASALWAPSA
ncbi:hypothetical protein EVAR_85520_1 [Eumeta japonica]|uniref:Uncharacterized protein n=1 Tax=Eumeta variegata TaxID=151549 RepID=A0A4C1VDB3_EUMVA|nr:hypothetical protein EVAR_85520_1 [Eumeta japonica]